MRVGASPHDLAIPGLERHPHCGDGQSITRYANSLGRADGLADGSRADANSGGNEDSQTNRHGDAERRLYSRRTVAL